MTQLLTLITTLHDHLDFPVVRLPSAYETRTIRFHDTDELGRLYFEAYEPGVACESLTEAIDNIGASFAGEHGELWPEASRVIEHDHALTGTILTVRQAPWERTPDCPFIIELFIDKTHRRRGVGHSLVQICMATTAESGEMEVALRVADDQLTGTRSLQITRVLEWHPVQ